MPDSQTYPSKAEAELQAKKLKRQARKEARKAAKIKLLTCEDCGVTLKTRSKAASHVKQHGHMARRVCTTCKMVFGTRKILRSHCATSQKHRLNLPEGSALPEPPKSKAGKARRHRHYSPEPTQAETEEKARRREEWIQLKKNRDEQLRNAPEEFHDGIEFGFSCLAEDYAEFFDEDSDHAGDIDEEEEVFDLRYTSYMYY
ncbi:hypothetical protein GGR51DRAFT_560942 [Nemania sp. FL0031]|nr:hypothetical protein GGR51DRAFT_560942 [Nemania sp. FL0031]